MAYRNDTQGARAIHLTNGTIKLVEPGAIAVVVPSHVKRLAPGLVECDDPELPPVPDDLAAELSGEAPPEVSMSLTKDKLLEIAAAEGVEVETDDNKADLIRKIEEARG